MACYSPIRLESAAYAKLVVACGQCIGCRLERSRQWAVRIMHEAQASPENCFITLTYDDKHIPMDGSLVYRDFQYFMRKLRKLIAPRKVRFFMCGEYGSKLGRPHFHACLFSYRFKDGVVHSSGSSGFPVFVSKELSSLWDKGFSSFGELSFESAAYVARYVMKKQTGDGEDKYYSVFDVTTGEIFPKLKEFCHMSLKPGIGSEWFNKFHKDIADGVVVCNGVEAAAPKYYMRRIKKLEPDRYADVVQHRFERSLEHQAVVDRSPPRLSVRAKVAFARLQLSKRNLK